MLKLKELFTDSARELKSIRALTITAVFIALNVTMDLLNLRIQFTPDLRVGFGFVCSAMIGMLFGPVMAMLGGFASDILGYMVNTGGASYFPGFTITAVLAGLVWGLFLYKRQVTFLRALSAKLIINLVLNTGLNSLWLYLLYNKAFFAGLPFRLLKNVTMLPVEVVLLIYVGAAVTTVMRRTKRQTA